MKLPIALCRCASHRSFPALPPALGLLGGKGRTVRTQAEFTGIKFWVGHGARRKMRATGQAGGAAPVCQVVRCNG